MQPRSPRRRTSYRLRELLLISERLLEATHLSGKVEQGVRAFSPIRFTDEITDWPEVRSMMLEGHWRSPFTEQASVAYLPEARIGHIEAELSTLVEKVERLTEQLRELQETIAERPVIRNAQLLDLGQADWVLTQPVAIVLEEYQSGEVIASIPELEVFATANSESEAILSLKRELLDLYQELSTSDPTELGPLPASWKRALNYLIRASSDASG